MKWSVVILVTVTLVVIQTTLGEIIRIGSIRPDLTLIFAVYLAFSVRKDDDAVLAAWLVGIFADLASIGPLGATSLIYLLAARLIRYMKDMLFGDDPFVQTVSVLFLAAFVHALWGLLYWMSYRSFSFGEIVQRSFFVALYSAVVTPLLLSTLSGIRPALGMKRSSWA